MLLEFETAVAVVPNCIVIGSKLDTDINANLCRLAFNGRALKTFDNKVRYEILKLNRFTLFQNRMIPIFREAQNYIYYTNVNSELDLILY